MSEVSNSAPAPAPSTQPNVETPEQGENSQAQPNQPVAPVKKKFKYKADNQDVEEELSDEEITSRLSLAKAAHKRMSEAATIKKQTEQFIKLLQENPMAVLNNEKIMGQKKFREIAEQFIYEQIQQESMTPEQREAIEKDKRLSDYERREKEQREQHEQNQLKQLESHYVQQFEKVMIEAFQSTNLPKNPFTVKRMAELMQKNLQYKLDLPPQELAKLVKEDMQNEQKHLISSASAEQLIEMFGEEITNKIRKHDLSKFKMNKPVVNKPVEKEQSAPEKRLSPREFTEQLKSKFKA